jgi:transposase
LKDTFNIPSETYYQWKEKLENGYSGIKVIRGRSRKIDKEKLKKAVEKNPDAYLYELAQQFGCTPQAVFLMLEKLNITRKKNPSLIMKSQKKHARNI